MDSKWIFNMKSKRGISGVVSAVILIGLVVSITVIVWVVVNNLIKEDLDQSKACFGNFEKVTLNSRYTCYNSGSGNESLRFSLNIGEIDVDKVRISISGSSKAKSFELTNEEALLGFLKNYNPGACKGPSTSCGGLDPSSCNIQKGCFQTGCIGGPIDCSNSVYQGDWINNCLFPCVQNANNCSGGPTCSGFNGDQPGCLDEPGCSWQVCEGGSQECEQISSESTCVLHSTAPACSWDSTCQGNANSCGSMKDSNSCALQLGCSWDDSEIDKVSLPERGGGFTYVFDVNSEGIGIPDSIEIAPTLDGKQCEVSDSIVNIDNCNSLVI